MYDIVDTSFSYRRAWSSATLLISLRIFQGKRKFSAYYLRCTYCIWFVGQCYFIPPSCIFPYLIPLAKTWFVFICLPFWSHWLCSNRLAMSCPPIEVLWFLLGCLWFWFCFKCQSAFLCFHALSVILSSIYVTCSDETGNKSHATSSWFYIEYKSIVQSI